MDPDVDVAVSWLPLYHDMGLVGLLALPMTTGVDLVQAAPQDFLAHPGNWMQWISDFRRHGHRGPELLVGAGHPGAEADAGRRPVEPAHRPERGRAGRPRRGRAPSSRRPAATASAPARCSPPSAWPSWPSAARSRRRCGAWSSTPSTPRRWSTSTWPSRVEADDHTVPGAWPCWAGRCRASSMRIVDPQTGEVLPERHVGELEIRGTSVTPGYYKRPEATAELFRDGWLRTGDLAYLVDGELVICGRIKDVIIVGGRNIYPQDIERAVGTVDGVRAGNVIAFGVEGYKGKESIVVVAETKATDGRGAAPAPSTTGCSKPSGVPPRDVMLVQPGTLPKTSSGKLQRSACKERYLNEELQLVG